MEFNFFVYPILIFLIFSKITFAETSEHSIKSLQKLCNSGDTKNCFELGFMYKERRCKGKTRLFKSIQILKKTCDGGYADAYYFVGCLYELGKGVKQKKEQNKFKVKPCDMELLLGCDNYKRLNEQGY